MAPSLPKRNHHPHTLLLFNVFKHKPTTPTGQGSCDVPREVSYVPQSSARLIRPTTFASSIYPSSLITMDSILNRNIQSQLTTLRRQYFQLIDPAQLRWPDDAILKTPASQAWMFHNLFNLDVISYSPPEWYQLRVLKLLVSRIERAVVDPEEDVRCPFSTRVTPSLAGYRPQRPFVEISCSRHPVC